MTADNTGRSRRDFFYLAGALAVGTGYTTNAALGACVVDFQMPVFRVAVESHPAFYE